MDENGQHRRQGVCERLLKTLLLILELLFCAIPMDFCRWLTMRQKDVTDRVRFNRPWAWAFRLRAEMETKLDSC